MKKKNKIMKKTIVFIILDLMAFTCFFFAYGPVPYFRNLLVTTAMNTMTHQYLAYVLYTEDMVTEIMSQNYFIAINEEVNLDDIVIDTSEKDRYDSEYDKEILTRDPGNDLYKLIELKVGNANAYLIAIYDPKMVHLLRIPKFGTRLGERVSDMCKRYGGIVCINGGGFTNGLGTGSGTPSGYVINDGEIVWSDGDSSTVKGDIIGITDEGKLKLMSGATGQEALAAGIMDGVEFGPFLIVNGKPIEIVGNPYGVAPRCVIAQRKDGVMLFLVTDGENYIDGASLSEIVDTLVLYGAYNAANLDGGQSTSLVIDGELYNSPAAIAKRQGGRYVVTGFGLIP